MNLTPAQKTARYRTRHPERVQAASHAARAKVKSDPVALAALLEYEKTRSRRRRSVDPKLMAQRVREANRRALYGLEPADFDAMLENQAGLCAVCCKAMTPGNDTNIDHCHETGRIRGLLCRRCNSGLGHLQDSLLFVSGAAVYLQVA
jgi:hypothetical protein